MAVTTETLTRYEIRPDPDKDYVYFVVKGGNGNLYKFGITDSVVSFTTAPGGASVFEANTFVQWFARFIDNSIELEELPRLYIDLEGGNPEGYMTDEIFELTIQQVNAIEANYDLLQLIRVTGIMALAQIFFIANKFGNLNNRERLSEAIDTMGLIGWYFVRNKTRYNAQKYNRDLRRLRDELVRLRSYTLNEANTIVLQIRENTETRFK